MSRLDRRRAIGRSLVHDRADHASLQCIETFRHVVEAAPTPLLIMDGCGRIVLVNARIGSLFGYASAELLGERIETLMPPRFRAQQAELRQALLKSSEARPRFENCELYGLRKDGREVPIEIALHVLRTNAGDLLLGAFTDFSERIRAEDRGQRQFQLLAGVIPQLVWMASPDGHLSWCNQRWHEYTGMKFEQLQGSGWQSVHAALELPRVRERWHACLVDGEPLDTLVLLKDEGGVFHPFHWRVAPIKNAEGGVERWCSTHTDVTGLEFRADVEQFMISVVQSAEDVILTKTLDGIVRSCNPAAELMLGYRSEELIGQSVTRLIPEERHGEEAMILDRVIRGERVADLETVRRRKNGSLVDVSLTVSPIRDERGRIVGASKIMRDITERHRAETELKRSHERIAIAAQAAGQGFWEYDIEAGTLRWDSQMFLLYGRPVQEGEQPYALWADSLHPQDRGRCEREMGDAIAGLRPFDTDFRIVQPTGAIRNIKSLARVRCNREGRAVHMVGLNYDITERKHDTEQLRALNAELEERVAKRTAALAAANVILAQKNEEVEAFVYIVSHDLRAPLVNIQGFASEISRSCSSLEDTLRQAALPAQTQIAALAIVREEIVGALRYISASTTKFQVLIDTLLLLSRTGRQDLRLEEADVSAIVESTILSLRQVIQKSGAAVIAEPMPSIRGDCTALGQVFSNLISNALKYLKPGRAGRILIGGEIANGLAHYWVRDNGVGIPSSAQRRLFQVFQRFHPHLASGEGMGLAIVKSIVERHGGKVWAESEEAHGTTFHVELPAAGNPGGG